MSVEERPYQSVEIIEIKDVDDLRFVGFLADGYPGAKTFRKNEDGNYEAYGQVVAHSGTRIEHFHPHPTYQLIVTNSRNKVATLQMDVNGEILEHKLNLGKNTVSLLKLSEADRYRFNWYKYYDADNQLITD